MIGGTQLLRFGVVGVMATATHVGVAASLIEAAGWHAVIGNAAAFLCAVLVSYLANYYWTFGTANRHARAVPRFAVIGVSGFLLNAGLMYGVVSVLQLDYRAGLAAVVTLVPALTFVASRKWAFG